MGSGAMIDVSAGPDVAEGRGGTMEWKGGLVVSMAWYEERGRMMG